MTKKVASLIGLVLALMAATVGAYVAGQLLILAFADPPPDVSWEEERRDLTVEWLWMVYLSPLLAILVAAIGTPALLLLHHLRRMDTLSYVAAGTVTGLLFGSGLASPRVAEAGMSLRTQGAVMGAGGALIFWTVLRLYALVIVFPAWFMRLTEESPSGET